jgi:hypothetical protein
MLDSFNSLRPQTRYADSNSVVHEAVESEPVFKV